MNERLLKIQTSCRVGEDLFPADIQNPLYFPSSAIWLSSGRAGTPITALPLPTLQRDRRRERRSHPRKSSALVHLPALHARVVLRDAAPTELCPAPGAKPIGHSWSLHAETLRSFRVCLFVTLPATD